MLLSHPEAQWPCLSLRLKDVALLHDPTYQDIPRIRLHTGLPRVHSGLKAPCATFVPMVLKFSSSGQSPSLSLDL